MADEVLCLLLLLPPLLLSPGEAAVGEWLRLRPWELDFDGFFSLSRCSVEVTTLVTVVVGTFRLYSEEEEEEEDLPLPLLRSSDSLRSFCPQRECLSAFSSLSLARKASAMAAGSALGLDDFLRLGPPPSSPLASESLSDAYMFRPDTVRVRANNRAGY